MNCPGFEPVIVSAPEFLRIRLLPQWGVRGVCVLFRYPVSQRFVRRFNFGKLTYRGLLSACVVLAFRVSVPYYPS
jgi:hypothetical protein